jgi:hypothetical protein
METLRISQALLRHLPKTTSWDQIAEFDERLARRKATRKLKLPKNADWDEICKKLDQEYKPAP